MTNTEQRWADQYQFDKNDGPTRLFVAASNLLDRVTALEAALRPFVDAYKKAHVFSDVTDDERMFIQVLVGDCRRAERALR
jgi:hypothetical protein